MWVVSREDDSEFLLQSGDHVPLGWSKDDQWIYFAGYSAEYEHGVYLRIPPTGGTVDTVAVLPDPPSIFDITMTPDGKKFVYAVMEAQSDLWLIEDFDPAMR